MNTSVRQEPRISVNKLGEYMSAAPLRRRRIIQDQKFPKTFIVARYTEAEEAIARFLSGQDDDDTFLEAEIERLNAVPAETEWEAQRCLLCAEALESFLDMSDTLELEGWEVQRTELRESAAIRVAGVDVSVRSEMLLRKSGRNGQEMLGAIKLHFSKTHPFSETSGRYVSTVLRMFLEEGASEEARIDLAHCLTVDVFSGQVYSAPRAQKRRRADVEAACEEIARAWPFALDS